jgi:hypothetical protein
MKMPDTKKAFTRIRRQICSVCKCTDKFNFHVPDEVWKTTVPRSHQNKVVCLPCFDEFARAGNVDYSEHIKALYFAGNQASFRFHTVSAQSAEGHSACR